jgi:predicted CXXCH cytochrome family protein
MAAALAVLLLPSAGFAYDEPHGQPETVAGNPNHGEVGKDCNFCHRADRADVNEDCLVCHGDIGSGPQPVVGKGPHGSYTAVSDRCDACHTIHAAGAGIELLSAATVTAACNSCHDGTGGHGVYGAIAAKGRTVGATHRIDTTNTVPGGNAATGGDATMTLGGLNGTLGCDDCHSPHDASTVATFTNERMRTSYDYLQTPNRGLQTNRLLRQHPGGSVTTVTVYGSDWCLACHKGRASGGATHNHPADSKASTTTPFYFENVARLASEAATSVVTTGTLGRTNRGFLMPVTSSGGRAAKQSGHAPICQQCHADARSVGSLNTSGTVATPAPWSVTSTDGLNPANNPRFQNFPHEAENGRMLVENGDDLCTNCHPPAALP